MFMEIILSYISKYVVNITINDWRLLGHERSCDIFSRHDMILFGLMNFVAKIGIKPITMSMIGRTQLRRTAFLGIASSRTVLHNMFPKSCETFYSHRFNISPPTDAHSLVWPCI